MKHKIGQLELEYRKDLRILICRWLAPITSSGELRVNYMYLLEHIKTSQATLHLVDTRQRGLISPEDEVWIMDVFFPAVEQAMPGTHHYAYLTTPGILLHIKEDVGFDRLDNLRPSTKIRVFDVERDAIHWLSNIRLNLPALKHTFL